jgi:transposase
MESLTLHVTPGSAGTEGGRRPTVVPAEGSPKPDPEVVPRTTRRYLTVAYKLKVLETVATLREQGHGAVGAYLRKEGLYYSSIRSWERLRDHGLLTSIRKGPREKNHDALLVENKQLRRKLQQAEKRLAKTELIVELQKKLSAIMDLDEPKRTGRNDGE